jgi:hypothetical protein
MSSPGRWSGALIAAALAVGAFAEPAAAKVTFAGIGDVRLSMSEAEVNDALGTPSASKPARNPDAVTLHYPRRKLEVLLHRGQDRVVGVYTTSRGQRTSSGLGVGSSSPVLRARLRGEKCGAAQRTVLCSVERDGRVMDFWIRSGKVYRVAVTTAG